MTYSFEEANEIAKEVMDDGWDDRMFYVNDEIQIQPSICHKCKRWYVCNICKSVSGKITKCNYMMNENT